MVLTLPEYEELAMFRKWLVRLVLLVVCITALGAQQVSEKKEIAIFPTGYRGWVAPFGLLSRIDARINEVFASMGRFSVIGMTQRLISPDLSSFIAEIKKYKEGSLEIPESVRLGEEIFTEEDFNRLTGSFIVVVPTLDLVYEGKVDWDTWSATVHLSVAFINVETMELIANITISPEGSAGSYQSALNSALDAIVPLLGYEIASIEEFTLKTGVIGVVDPRTIVLQMGRDMGIALGDEFRLTHPELLPTGSTVEKTQGVVKISEVMEDSSYGYLLYSDGTPYVGEQLREIPRIGMDFEPYLKAVFTFGNPSVLVGGVRATLSKGVFDIRPALGFEVAFGDGVGMLWGLPINIYAGAEYSWYLGRVAIRPALSFGLGGVIPITEFLFENSPENFLLTHVGGRLEVQISYLFSERIRAFGSVGGDFWASIFENFGVKSELLGKNYGGLTVGGGLIFKL